MNCIELSFLNSCTPLSNINAVLAYFSETLHVPLGTIILLLSFPLVMTITSLLRHYIGVKTLGSYVPTIIIFAFLAMGLFQGVFFFIIVVSTAMLMKVIMSKFRILYLPRMTIVMTVVTIAVLFILFFAGLLNMKSLLDISLFPLLMLIMLAEKFILVQIKEGNNAAFSASIETLLMAVVFYIILTSHIFLQTMVTYPYIILFLIPINLLAGKFTGMRISEYFRFQKIINKK